MAAWNYVDGRNFILFIQENGGDWTPIGASMDCTLTIQQEAIETLPANDWRACEYVRGKTAWAVSVSTMIWLEDGEIYNPFDLLQIDPTNLRIRLASVSRDKMSEQTDYAPNGYFAKEGNVIVTSITKNAPLSGKATYSIEMQGVGALEDMDDDEVHSALWYDADLWYDVTAWLE